eukprot:6503207-Alexandrium_andersonii.AAC.1
MADPLAVDPARLISPDRARSTHIPPAGQQARSGPADDAATASTGLARAPTALARAPASTQAAAPAVNQPYRRDGFKSLPHHDLQ